VEALSLAPKPKGTGGEAGEGAEAGKGGEKEGGEKGAGGVGPPRRPLLVLELNGLLIHRVFEHKAAKGPRLCRAPDDKVGAFQVWDRPHLRPFVAFCLERFEVAVFSSAKMHNVRGLVKHVFGPDFEARLAFVWDQDRCEVAAERHPDNPHKPVFLKCLAAVECEWPGRFGPDGVLLVDDDAYKARKNPPHTAIHPPAWTPPPAGSRRGRGKGGGGGDGDGDSDGDALGEGGVLRTFLEGLHAHCAGKGDAGAEGKGAGGGEKGRGVSEYVREHDPFGAAIPDALLQAMGNVALA